MFVVGESFSVSVFCTASLFEVRHGIGMVLFVQKLKSDPVRFVKNAGYPGSVRNMKGEDLFAHRYL